tara:strand:- start:329 stop:565 length:237 start_codon:yes stop_codon:yes gene_type:complete
VAIKYFSTGATSQAHPGMEISSDIRMVLKVSLQVKKLNDAYLEKYLILEPLLIFPSESLLMSSQHMCFLENDIILPFD